MRPTQPRSSGLSFGWNMQRRIAPIQPAAAVLRLGVDDHLGDAGDRDPDALLHARGGRVRRSECLGGIEGEREEHHETLVRMEEADLAWRPTRRLADDA